MARRYPEPQFPITRPHTPNLKPQTLSPETQDPLPRAGCFPKERERNGACRVGGMEEVGDASFFATREDTKKHEQTKERGRTEKRGRTETPGRT